MKKKDWIIIVVLCLVIGVGYFIYQMTQSDNKDIIEIYYKNKVVEKLDIHKDQVYTLKGSYGDFSLEIKDGKYHAVHVECPNHDCEKVGWVSQGSSRQIVCVPNEIYVIQVGVEDNI